MAQAMETTASPQELPRMELQITRLGEIVDRLETLVVHAHERLASIIDPSEPSKESNDSPLPPTPSMESELTGRIRESATRVENSIGSLQELLNRVEV